MAYTEMKPLAKVSIDTATQRQTNGMKRPSLSFMEDIWERTLFGLEGSKPIPGSELVVLEL